MLIKIPKMKFKKIRANGSFSDTCGRTYRKVTKPLVAICRSCAKISKHLYRKQQQNKKIYTKLYKLSDIHILKILM